MKKVIIAAAIVCAAVFAQAATANWSASAIAASPLADKASYTSYLIDNTIGGYTDYTQLAMDIAAGKTINGLLATKSGLSYNDTTKLYSLAAAGVSITDNGYTGGNAINALTVILDGSGADAKNYFVAEKDGASFNTKVVLNAGFGSQSGASWQSIPEPTSAMLMLLGMAGLALRRRRA